MENEKLQLTKVNLFKDGEAFKLEMLDQKRSLTLSRQQFQYMEKLMAGNTIEQLVVSYLNKGTLLHFGELYSLVKQLTEAKVILNRSYRMAFLEADGKVTESPAQAAFQRPPLSQFQKLPFLRNLDQKLVDLFYSHAISYGVSDKVRICTFGQKNRDLFFLIEGEAGIYRANSQGQRQLIAKLKAPAVFGEGGFLLDQPRTADVITWGNAQLIRIQHQPDFDKFIQKPTALNLQRRFWVLHALTTSPLFKDFPTESLDELAFAGEMHKHKAGDWLFKQGDSGNTFGILVQGSLQIIQDGKTINKISQGECFGEISLFLTGGVRSAGIKCESDALVEVIQAKQFYQLLSHNLILAYELELLARQRIANSTHF